MRRSPAGKQEVLNVAFAGEVAIYMPLKGVHAQAFDAPMMEVEDHLWIQLAMESKKIQARLTLMLMMFSELWEKPKVEFGYLLWWETRGQEEECSCFYRGCTLNSSNNYSLKFQEIAYGGGYMKLMF